MDYIISSTYPLNCFASEWIPISWENCLTTFSWSPLALTLILRPFTSHEISLANEINVKHDPTLKPPIHKTRNRAIVRRMYCRTTAIVYPNGFLTLNGNLQNSDTQWILGITVWLWMLIVQFTTYQVVNQKHHSPYLWWNKRQNSW